MHRPVETATQSSRSKFDAETSEVWIKSIADPQALSPSEMNKLGSILSLRLTIWRLSAAAIDDALVNVDPGANYCQIMAIQNDLQKLAEEKVAP